MPHFRAAVLLTLLALAICLQPGTTAAQGLGGGGKPPVDITVDFAAGVQGGPPMAVVTMTPQSGWYTYAHDNGDMGMPTALTARLDPSGKALNVIYPLGTTKPNPLEPSETMRVYAKPTPFFIKLPSEPPHPESKLSLHLSMLLCSDKTCLPAIVERTVSLPPQGAPLPKPQSRPWWPQFLGLPQDTGGAEAAATPPNVLAPLDAPDDPGPSVLPTLMPRYHQASLEVTGLFKAVVLALLAGFIPNFMPCVLPVIGLKLGSFVSACDGTCTEERQRSFSMHNLYFAAGVMLYFAFLAVVFSLADMAWGQFFQRPAVVVVLTGVVFAMALSLMGLYHLPIIDVASAPDEDRRPRLSAFVTGLLATLLATPCSGPLLGGVLAFALTGPTIVVASVLTCVGLGMAAPYLLLAARPSLVRLLPRPGAWNVHLERFVGLVLAGTCIYLLSILPKAYQMKALILMWLTAVVAWLVPLLGGLKHSDLRRMVVKAAGFVIIGFTAWWATWPMAPPPHWEDYSEKTLAANLGQQAMLVDFTADWCVSCKFLERTTLVPDNLAAWHKEYGLRYLKVDLTGENPEGQRLLAALGAKSIPTVAVFPAGPNAAKPLVLRDLFTSGELEDALDALLD